MLNHGPGVKHCFTLLLGFCLSWIMPAWYAHAFPTLVHQAVLDAFAGQAVMINVTVTDTASAVTQVKLYYRRTGSLGFREEFMTKAGYNYFAQIPGAEVASEGLEYYIEAFNQAGQVSTAPAMNARIAPYRVMVRKQKPGPAIELLSPEVGAVVAPEELVIVIALDAGTSQIDLSSLKLFFDEQDVTAHASVSLSLISYVPPENLAEGLHGIRVIVKNQEGRESQSPTWGFTVQRQTWAEKEKAKAPAGAGEAFFQLRGNMNLESQYTNLFQSPPEINYLNQPAGFLNRLNLNLKSRIGSMDLLGSAYLTSEETPGRQPVDRFRLELIDQHVNVVLGDFYPDYSDYSLNNTFVRGGQLVLTSGQLEQAYSQFTVTGGISLYPIEGRGVLNAYGDPLTIEADGTFARWLWGTRWQYDFLPGTGLALNYATLNDYAHSIQFAGTNNPSNNHVATGEAQIKFYLSDVLTSALYGEYGLSYFDEDQMLTSISLGDAYRAGNRWQWDNRNVVQIEYKHTGANYVSLANPWLISDWQGVAGDIQLYFLDENLSFLAAVDTGHDNLNSQKTIEYYAEAAGTTVTTGTVYAYDVSTMVNYRAVPYFSNLSLGFSLNRQQDNAWPEKLIDNQTWVGNFSAGSMVPLAGDQLLANISYAYNIYQDLAREKLSGDVTISSWLSSLMYLLGNRWSWAAGFGLTQNHMNNQYLASAVLAEQTISYQLWNLKATWKILPGTFDLSAGWENISSQDDQKTVDNTLLTWTLASSYYFASRQALFLNLALTHYTDHMLSNNNYGEFITNIKYSIQF